MGAGEEERERERGAQENVKMDRFCFQGAAGVKLYSPE